MSFEIVHLLMFTIPGFFLVRSYNKAKGTKIESDFEYLILSFFWGLIALGLLGWLMPEEKLDLFFQNIYAGMAVLSAVYMILGHLFGGGLDKPADKLLSFIMRLIKIKK